MYITQFFVAIKTRCSYLYTQTLYHIFIWTTVLLKRENHHKYWYNGFIFDKQITI